MHHLHVLCFPRCLHRQRDALKGHAQYLRPWITCHLLFLSACVQLVTYARLSSPCTPTSLSSRSTSDPCLDEFRQSAVGIVSCFFNLSSVDDIDDVIDGDGRLKGKLVEAGRMRSTGHCQTSATLVATTIFHFEVETKTVRCSLLERFACRGRITAFALDRVVFNLSMHCRIS